MNLSDFRKIFRKTAAGKEERWLGKLAEMIRIDSQIGKEAGLAAFITAELRKLGVECDTFDIPSDIEPENRRREWLFKNRPNVVGKISGSGRPGKSLALNCHIDTQPIYPRECWTHDPFGAEIEDGKVFGRGAVDNKAGIAEVLFLVDCFQEMGLSPGGDLVTGFVVEDETTGLGTLACLKRGYRTDGAVIVDGTNLDNAFFAHPGHVNFSITIHGLPATSASAFRSLNPLTPAVPIMDALKKLEAELREDDRGQFSRQPNQSVNLNLFFKECGYSANAVPSRAILHGSMSFCPPMEKERLKKMICELVQSAWAGRGRRDVPPPTVSFDGYCVDPTFSDAESELSGVLLKSAIEEEGINVRMLPMRGIADIRHFIETTGGNCFLYGPGEGGGVHINDEYFVVSEMRKFVNIVSRLVYEWCGLYKD